MFAKEVAVPTYLVSISPSPIMNDEDYEIEAENEEQARAYAAEQYLQDRAPSMDFDFEVTKL